MDDYEHKVSNHWGKMAKENSMLSWTDSKLILKYVHEYMTGNPNLGWLQYACEKYLSSDVEHGLSLGCGSGSLERQCRKMNYCKLIDATDISTDAIEEAKRLAHDEKINGINYEVKNLENLSLPANFYNVVFASSTIHHLKNLEHIFKTVQTSLKPNGYFILVEYVGPSKFQFPKKQVDIINEILSILTKELKKQKFGPNKIKEKFFSPPIKFMNKNDPSEAIRSADIVSLLPQYFTIVEKKDYGGTILHMLLQYIISNFNPDNDKDNTILSLLILLEKILIREQVLNSDFAFIIAKKVDSEKNE